MEQGEAAASLGPFSCPCWWWWGVVPPTAQVGARMLPSWMFSEKSVEGGEFIFSVGGLFS